MLIAIHYLTELNCLKKHILDDAPEHIITVPLKHLQGALRRWDIWLDNSFSLRKSPREAVAGERMAGSASPHLPGAGT
ncbi:transposase [Citrobacter koseri]|uniref:Transposase n=1 Tax=Citrobacter koseri TaxID=545 RepID=A0A078LQJ6_CITKO|nr:transposase [Citrobacter koseri]